MDSFITKFTNMRTDILNAFGTANIDSGNQLTNPNKIPDDLSKNFTAGIVTLKQESGRDGTRKRYVTTDLQFDIFLIVDAADGVSDPDLDLYTLKESFRDAYKTNTGRDIRIVEYYNSYVQASNPVRIAKMTTETERT